MSEKTLAPSKTTQRDKKGLKFMSVVGDAYDKAGLPDEEAQRVNEASGLSEIISNFIEKHRHTNQFVSEQTDSEYVYPDGYEVLPINEQIEKIGKIFNLKTKDALEFAKNLPQQLPDGAEGWFAVPRWDAVAGTYNDAVEIALAKLDKSRKFYNYRKSELSDRYLRQTQRAIDMWQLLYSEQKGDIIIIAAQFGMRHRGKSVRRTRETFSAIEFGLGIFATCCMLLTHPKRLQKFEELEFDCGGDDYNWCAAGDWSGSPGFHFGGGEVRLNALGVDFVFQDFGCASAFLLGSAA